MIVSNAVLQGLSKSELSKTDYRFGFSIKKCSNNDPQMSSKSNPLNLRAKVRDLSDQSEI